jgi:type II secretory pathway component PulJ
MMRLGGRVRGGDDGLGMVELLVAVALTSVIATLVVTTVVQSFAHERRTVARVESLNVAKVGMERLSREVRAAAPILQADDDRLRIEVHRADGARTLTYEVDTDGDRAHIDFVEEHEDGGTLTGTLVSGLDPDAVVFTYLDKDGVETEVVGDMRRVRLRLRVLPAHGDTPVDLVDEITVRNARDPEEA